MRYTRCPIHATTNRPNDAAASRVSRLLLGHRGQRVRQGGLQEGPADLAARDRGATPDRQLARQPAPVPRAGRPLRDPNAQLREHLRRRRAVGEPVPQGAAVLGRRLRQGQAAHQRDEPHWHDRRPVARER